MNDFENGFKVNTDIEEEPQENTEKTSFTNEVIDWLEILTFSIIAVVIVFSFFFKVATVEGRSMNNTLAGGDKLIISDLGYEPKYGDIVVISRNTANSVLSESSDKEPIIKRVIATGGQTVNIDFETGTVYVDNVALKEDYISSPTYNKYDVDFPVYVPEGYIFVMGDNRAESLDSRDSRIGEGGIVDKRYVLGHAVFRFFPFNKIGGLG